MRRHAQQQQKNLLVTIATLAALFVIAFFVYDQEKGKTQFAHAGTGDNVSGFAWSQTIGWISFNCTDTGTCGTNNYGVAVDAGTGNFSGYAWSDNIGWINFAPSADPTASVGTACTSAPCRARVNAPAADGTMLVTGWARACAVLTDCAGYATKTSAVLGGWDGWIKLSDPSWTNPADRTYMGAPGTPYDTSVPRHNGVFFDDADGRFKGFAWGGEVIGWVDFFPTATVGVTIVSPPILTVVPEIQQDFGDVEINTTKDMNFTVTNTGGAGSFLSGTASVIDTTYFSCVAGCDYSGAGIAVGSPHTVTIRFSPGATPGSNRTTQVSFTGVNTAPPSSVSPTVFGNGVVPVTGSGELNFGNVVVGKTKDLTLTITNNMGINLVGNLVMPFPQYTCVPGCALNVSPNGGTQDVIIRFAPIAVQTYEGSAYVDTYPTVTFLFKGAGVTGSFRFRDQ